MRPLERALEEDGYSVFPVVSEFLAEFGNLSIRYLYKPNSEDRLHFDAAAAAAVIFHERVSQYMELLGTPLCVIGEYYTDHYTLLMDPTGKVYGAFDEVMNLLGGSGREAIENIISGKNIERIDEGACGLP